MRSNSVILEKFKQDSDPIQDMGIGMIKFWAEAAKIEGSDSPLTSSQKYYGDTDHCGEAYYVWQLLKIAGSDGKEACYLYLKDLLSTHHGKLHMFNEDVNIDEILRILREKFQLDLKNPLKENLNEKFVEESDPIYDMGIGKEYSIKKWLEYYSPVGYGENYAKKVVIRKSDKKIDADFEISFNSCGLSKLPDFIQFGTMDQTFCINWNNLKNLKGCPEVVNGGFYCNGNPLESLEGCPKIVRGIFCISEVNGFTEEDIRKVCDCDIVDILAPFQNSKEDVYRVKEDYHEKEREREGREKLWESLHETFTADSDPIRDMGIGIITFENIKPGDIIRKKLYTNQLQQLREYDPNIGKYAVIINVKRKQDFIMLHVAPFEHLSTVLYAREAALSNKYDESEVLISYKNFHFSTKKYTTTTKTWELFYDIIQHRQLASGKLEESENKYNKMKYVKEDMGGVSAPMSTLTNTPGMGSAVPPSPATNGIGSGDNWGNSLTKKPYTQKASPKKKAKKKAKKIEEENVNPYDKRKIVREHL